MRAAFRFRLRILLAVLGSMALLLLGRLFMVQIVHGAEYTRKAERQYTAGATTLYNRGAIYFTRKDGTLISAATLDTGYLVAINPEILTDPQAAYDAISALTPLDHDAFFTSAAKKSDPYEEVAHHLSQKDGEALSAKKIPGVLVIRERWRAYPGGTLAAQTIGLIGYNDDNTLSGRYGLERYYDGALERSGATYRNFFAQLFSNLGDVFVDARNARSADLVTTIEPEVEQRLMDDLAQVQERYHSKETGGIIMDPATGEIIALGSMPTFDPNNFEHTDISTFNNPLVEHVYEFGSIFKTLTMASGLDAGVITPQMTYNDTGCITVDASRICNWDRKARGVIPMKQVIMQSLNVGASWIATRLGHDEQRAYFTKLFGQPTGIDLPGETSPLLGNLQSPRQVEYDNMSFGQGIAVTPVQMIRALGALADGGAMVEPHIVRKEVLLSGETNALDWSEKTPVFSPQAVQDTVTMMDETMDEKVSNGAAKIPTMSVAVKTGTAQLTKPGGGYYEDRFFHSFVGFFPSYAPRFIILLYTNDPKGVQYSSETLTTSFMDLTHFLINYYDLRPDRGLTEPS